MEIVESNSFNVMEIVRLNKISEKEKNSLNFVGCMLNYSPSVPDKMKQKRKKKKIFIDDAKKIRQYHH